MPLLPITQPLGSKAFFAQTCRLYRQGWIKLLPLSLFSLILYHFTQYGETLMPAKWVAYYAQIVMFIWIILFFMFFTFFTAFDQIGKQQTLSYRQAIVDVAERFLGIIGCMISMSLLPAILLGAGIGVYLFLGVKQVPAIVLYAWMLFIQLITFAAIVPKILAPILTCTQKQEANLALDNSIKLIKGHYITTFLYTLYSLLIFIFIAKLPNLLPFYIPVLTQKLAPIWVQLFSTILLASIGPWSFALMLTHQYNLQAYKGMIVKEKSAEIKTPPLKKLSQENQSNITF